MIGISSNQQEGGTALFVPLHHNPRGHDRPGRRRQRLLGAHHLPQPRPSRCHNHHRRHPHFARLPGQQRDQVREAGEEVAGSATITTTLAVVGLLIVAISMAGLAGTLTMSVLERTREIGILRSIGARARDIRRIFDTETLVLAATGWVLAVPMGYLIDRLLVWMVNTVIHLEIPFTFPPGTWQ